MTIVHSFISNVHFSIFPLNLTIPKSHSLASAIVLLCLFAFVERASGFNFRYIFFTRTRPSPPVQLSLQSLQYQTLLSKNPQLIASSKISNSTCLQATSVALATSLPRSGTSAGSQRSLKPLNFAS